MPESDFRPEDSSESGQDVAAERLNASELQTVLDMLAVMETAEELTQLQALTELQKRQVWEATPEALKQKLWQLRDRPAKFQSAAQSIANERPVAESLEAEIDLEDSETEAELDDEIEDLGQNLELTAESYPSLQTSTQMPLTEIVQSGQTGFADRSKSPKVDRVSPKIGDWIILKAHAKLTASELKAIWRLERIEGSEGSVTHANLGTRSYPLSWMIVYPKAQAEPAEASNKLLGREWDASGRDVPDGDMPGREEPF